MTQATITGGGDERAGRLRAMAEHLAATIRLSRAMVETGRRVDIAGLDGGIGLLCAQALDLPQAQGRALVPFLAALLAEVDALATTLAAARGPPPPPAE